MDWHHPEILYLILPLCAAWLGLALYSDGRRRAAREAFVGASMQPRILPTASRMRFWIRTTIRELAIVCGLITLAGPRFGTEYEQIIPRGSDLYVLIDVSRSMLAEDVPPSRLARAKADVAALLNRLGGERVGLIAFAGQAVVKCPLTVDYDSFRRALNDLDPGSAPRGGTAVGDAIRRALEVFQASAERDQAILLITDGDDQQSYPQEAAAQAAERQVTIFTVGLGDADQGARVPQSTKSGSFVEYQGEQVWSKLDSTLLRDIALKTSGVYIPAGTRAYDLGELYTSHLQGRRGSESGVQQRIRRSERFQIFLLLTILALLLDLVVSPFRKALIAAALCIPWILPCSGCGIAVAAESHKQVREGLKLYSQQQYEAAQQKFAAAAEQLNRQNSTTAAIAIAAFDEACAFHRKGDLEQARDRYLNAGLSPDRSIATAAHFNLGTMAAEQAKTLAGDQPELIPPEKRQEVLDQLQQAIVAYRHCLELQPDHAQSRRNLELVRQWIRYYSGKWNELDRQKRRDESDLITFLDFLIESQTALRTTVAELAPNTRADTFAELKRLQQELREEIPTLREKIDIELRPQDDQTSLSAEDRRQMEEGISLLQHWASAADERMSAATDDLGNRNADRTSSEQQLAIDELERIRDAVIPFHPLLQQELTEQTAISAALTPMTSESGLPSQGAAADAAVNESSETISKVDPSSTTQDPADAAKSASLPSAPLLEIDQDDYQRLTELQQRALRRARLLGPKAEAELLRTEADASATAGTDPAGQPGQPSEPDPSAPQSSPGQPDPELVRQGYLKAIELAPKAVEQMEAAARLLEQQDAQGAAPFAEEARRILEEIQQAQPKNDQQNQADQQQNQQNEDQKNEQQSDQKQDKDENQDQQQPDNQQSEQSEQSDSQKQDHQPEPKQQQMSRDRVEEALRKVREREQEKRERDRELRVRMLDRSPVDKDW